MNQGSQHLVLTTAPFLRDGATTPRIMREMLLLALAVLAAAVWNFGLGALLVVTAATLGAAGTEWFFSRGTRPSPIRDGSALLTGVLLGLTLPPGFPLWMAFIGGVAGMGLGKLVWGGLGLNAFNPALVGRAFLQASFPTAITTWTAPVDAGQLLSVPPSQFAAPLMQAHVAVDAVSAATPLGLAKFEHQFTELLPLVWGHVAGSLGETSALLLVACGVWMVARRLCDWRLPVATVLSVLVCAGLMHAIDPANTPGPLFMVCSGGLLFGAVFMVTDPVTTPTTARGAWIFGAGVGFIVVLIRLYGGLPEGVMYAILLMNAVTPHIDRYTQPRPFGG